MLVIARRELIRPSVLAFPGGSGGFDPSHPASNGALLSAVAFNGTMRSLLTGKPGTNFNGPTFGIDTALGPAMTFTGTTPAVKITGNPTTNNTSATIAAIIRRITISTAIGLFQGSGTTNGWLLQITASGQPGIGIWGGTSFTTSATIGNFSDPAFVAGSSSPTAQAVVVRNLRTGQVFSETGSIVMTSTAGDGTYVLGNFNSLTSGAKANYVACQFSSQFMPLAQLLQWAADPWSFWYPK